MRTHAHARSTQGLTCVHTCPSVCVCTRVACVCMGVLYTLPLQPRIPPGAKGLTKVLTRFALGRQQGCVAHVADSHGSEPH